MTVYSRKKDKRYGAWSADARWGDKNDPKSRVAQLKKDQRNYALLAELNTRPRTTYIAAVRNPNSALKPAEKA